MSDPLRTTLVDMVPLHYLTWSNQIYPNLQDGIKYWVGTHLMGLKYCLGTTTILLLIAKNIEWAHARVPPLFLRA